ncbi:minor tail protein [Arthrobacter phage Kitkat]|uniref:Minor tail protein n=2 Tax=Kelleziovirus kitkat TaxID=1982238 RepID=A0A140G6L2_9CAUD|nr:tail protein [Arthrobacter phage Kitkat]AMM44297.1 minor tail protein [Arthrobacter phage Kitkat]QGJ96473.1 minor tail protein [Arthrobacter phage BeatusComedenti]
MANSTAEYWDVDGVSLQTYAQNIKSWGGSREGVPPLRGDDKLIPFMPGRRFVKKVPDSRTLTLEGWIAGQEAVDVVVRRNQFWNPVPSSMTSWAVIPGTGGTAGMAVVPAGEQTPVGVLPFGRATWTVQGSSGSAGFLVTTNSASGKAGDVRSASVWTRTNQPLNMTMLFRFRNGAAPVGQLLPAYAVQVVDQWTEWRLDGAVATADWNSIQLYALVNNTNPVPAGTTIDLLVPTIEDKSTALGVYGPGVIPDSETLVNRIEPVTSQPILVRLDYRSSRQATRNNWRALRNLLWTPGRQIALTRRWYDANGVLQTATAMAQYSGGMEPDVEAGGHRLKFTVDLFLADPFFYGAEVTETLTRTTQTKTIKGDWSSRKARIELTGAQGPTAMTVNGSNPHGLTYSTAIAAGVTAVLDIENFTAKEGANGKTASVTHSGNKFWFEPEPGAQSITVSGTGSGAVKYIYQPAWF